MTDELQEQLISRRGKAEYLRFKKGEPLSYKQAILAQCYVCYIEGADSKELDCMSGNCSLYQFQSYNPNKTKRYSVETLAKMSARMKAKHTT
jgi:hypothetical protein